MKREWLLDPETIYLNHGSYGATPKSVLAEQQRWRERLERDPVHFFHREYERALNEARQALAAFVGARPDDLAFLPNATMGVNTVLGSFHLSAGDEVLITSHGYNACNNAVRAAAERRGAKVVVAPVPFPIASAEQAVDAITAAVTARTRLAVIDHVTSATALVLPIGDICRTLEQRGVAVLVDGAHAPGMLPLVIEPLGASYYAANCHKWLCAPKGAGFLWVRSDRQPTLRPLAISHGATAQLRGLSRFRVEFDWTGTSDPSAFLSVPAAISALDHLVAGGWPEVMYKNRSLALQGRALLCQRLQLTPPCPDDMIGSMATLPLPDAPASRGMLDPLAEALYAEHRIELPVFHFPEPPKRWMRISAQLYNTPADYDALAQALLTLVSRQATAKH